MHDGLPSRCAVVDANVVAGRVQLTLEAFAHACEKFEKVVPLVSFELKERRDVAARYDERVTA